MFLPQEITKKKKSEEINETLNKGEVCLFGLLFFLILINLTKYDSLGNMGLITKMRSVV